MAKQRPLEDHLAADRAQLAQREQIGDRLSAPRELEHFAYFSRKSTARDAAAALTSAGFRVALTRSGLSTLVTARHDSDVLPESVERTTRLLIDLVESRGGVYDGWGGTVVPTG